MLFLLAAGMAYTFEAGKDVSPPPENDVVRIGPGVKPPKIRSKQEPTYTGVARDAGVQGMCLLELVVDTQGMPQNITVLSPLGFGLDDSAISAVSKWRFVPGMGDALWGC